MKKIMLLVATMGLVAVGAATFAAFESHLIDVRAHVEKATYVTPNDLNFGTTIMQQSYHKSCDPVTDPTGASGNCLAIHLSASFLTQPQFQAVDYNIYCEDKAVGDPNRGDGNITPFMQISDSDPSDANDAVNLTTGCGTVAYSTSSTTLHPVLWAHGVLDKSFDKDDLWDLAFFAPVCRDNYNAETDPISPADLAGRPGGGIIDPAFCHKGPGPDSDEYTDLASNIKFQVELLQVAGTP
jgi:hypothetical protein